MSAQRTLRLNASFAGDDTRALVDGLRRLAWVPEGPPASFTVDHEDAPAGETFDDGMARARKEVEADYPYPGRLVVVPGGVVTVGRANVPIAIPEVLAQLATLPFEVAAFGSFHIEWSDGSLGTRYRAPGFGGEHVPLGWGAAFRGRGHDRLVSRRWLEDGPWKLWKGDGDVSLVQFHDLDAPPAQALDEARPGHARLGIGDSGGYLQRPFVYRGDLKGLYARDTATMRVVVLGRELPDRELLEWAALRAERRDAATDPVTEIGFVFPDATEGEANRARLERYGHQVYVIRAGVESRIDASR